MFARPQLLFKHAWRVFFLSLMIASAMLPAHFSRASSGRWVDVCTQKGVAQVWHSDAPQGPSIKGSATAAPALKDGLLHPPHQPACPWCLFSLPALSLLLAFWFLFVALRLIPTPHFPAHRSLMLHHWRWPDPRAPPIQLI